MTTRIRGIPIPIVASDDMIRCHRFGYTSITPQSCLEKHTLRPEPCNGCTGHTYSLKEISQNSEMSEEDIKKLAANRIINTLANPHFVIDQHPLEQEEIMNSRSVFVNGLRAPTGFFEEIHTRGNNNDTNRYQMVLAKKVVPGATEKEIKHILIDDLISGSKVRTFEWKAGDEKTKVVDGKLKNGDPAKLYTLKIATGDEYTR